MLIRLSRVLVWIAFLNLAPVPFASADSAPLRVGMSAIDMDPEIGIPLAGYGSTRRRLKPLDWKNEYKHSFFFKPSTGTHSHIRSKVMVLEKAKRYLIFVSLDTIGVEARFTSDLAEALRPLGIREENLMLSGTHTHSGPGTLSKTLPLNLIATDFYKDDNYRYFLEKVVQSIHIALDRLEPADLFTSHFIAEGIQKNKFRKKDQQHFNKRASFLLARSKEKGHLIGGLVNFAVHGGGMPIELTVFSSDFPGQIELGIEGKIRERNPNSADDPVVLFMNGAEGDVATPERGVEYIENLGREFARQAEVALDPANMTPVAPEFSIRTDKIWLGIPGSPLKFCTGGFLKRSPIPLRAPLIGLLGQFAPLTAVKIGHITMMSWPGEPSTTLGYALQDTARKMGQTDPWVLGLTNDYKAYFTTKSEYFEGAYDSCSSLYNWRGGQRILKKYKKMLAGF